MFCCLGLFILIFNIKNIEARFGQRRGDRHYHDSYIPSFRQSYSMYPSNLRLQTHDRSLVDNRIPNRVRNTRDFSEFNPFTDPAGVKGIDSGFQAYLTYHVNSIGIATALLMSRKKIEINKNSRLKKDGGIRMKSRRFGHEHFPRFSVQKF